MKKILYINNISLIKNNSGVIKKIESIIYTLNNLGFKADCLNLKNHIRKNNIYTLFKMVFNYDIVFIRSLGIYNIFIIPILILFKIKRTIIFLEVPTPFFVLANEIKQRGLNNVKNLVNYLAVYILSPIVYSLSDYVIQYAREEMYTLIKMNYKVKLIPNGINPDKFKLSKSEFKIKNNTITLIAVSGMAPWHNYERIILSLSEYIKNNKTNIIYKLIIVGEGGEKKKLVFLTNKLFLNEFVSFTGHLENEELDSIFRTADIGIGSLGPYRKNLNFASELKIREYVCRGLPIILSSEDPQLSELNWFVFKVKNNDDKINLEKLTKWFYTLEKYGSPSIIREYAIKNMDNKVIYKKMLEELNLIL
jgi:glycosyltransferase involved in cell wall biosynthesis